MKRSRTPPTTAKWRPKRKLTPEDLPPRFNKAVQMVLAYDPRKNKKQRD